MLGKVTLRKVSGICAILSVVLIVVGFALSISTGVSETGDALEVLPQVDDNKTILGIGQWLFILIPVVYLGAVAGIFQAVRGAGEVMWLALLASVVGVVFIILSAVIGLPVIYEVATPYVEAGPDAGAELLVLGDTLFSLMETTQRLGDAIDGGIATLLYSLAMLRLGFAPRWVVGLGLITSLGHWLGLLSPTSNVFELMAFVSEITFLMWLAAVGVVLLRKPRQQPMTAELQDYATASPPPPQ